MLFIRSFLAGLKESLAFHRAARILYRSATIRTLFVKCLAFNGVFFVLSVFLFNAMLSQADYRNQMLMSGLYYLFCILPLYIISFVLNAGWYNKIAKRHMYLLQQKQTKEMETREEQYRNKRQQKDVLAEFQSQLVDNVYSALLFIGMALQCSLLSLSSRLFWVQLVMFCWLYSFHCWHYKWAAMGYDIERRKMALANNWTFFLGFGIPLTLASSFTSYFVSYGIFAFIFPIVSCLSAFCRSAFFLCCRSLSPKAAVYSISNRC